MNDTAEWTPEVIGVHLILVVLAAAIAVAAYRRGKRRSEFGESAIWILGIFVLSVVVGTFYFSGPETPQSPFVGYLCFIWICAAFGCYQSWARKEDREIRGRLERSLDLIGIAGCLFAMGVVSLLPAIAQNRELVNRTVCKGRLKHLALAFYNHADVHGAFPASADGDPAFSWRVAILPYLDQAELQRRYDFASPWDSNANLPIARTQVQTLQCPSRVGRKTPKLLEDELGRYYSQYSLVTGLGTVGRGVKLDEIKDGTTNTILVVEACGLDLIWTEPKDMNIGRQPEGINLPSPTRGLSPGWISSHHPGGANVLFADGYIRFISDRIDPKVLRAMTTIDANDDVKDF